MPFFRFQAPQATPSTVLAPFGGRPVAPTFEGEEAATCVVGDLVLPPFGGRPVAPSFEGEEAATCVVGDWDYTMHYYEDYLESTWNTHMW